MAKNVAAPVVTGETVSTALFKEDVKRLTELKELEGDKSVAVTFRRKFGALLRSHLIEAADRRLAALKKEG